MTATSIEHRGFTYHYTYFQIQYNGYIQKVDGPPSQLSMLFILLHQLLYLDPSSQSNTDALYTITPTARSNTMHICKRQIDPPGQLSIDALHTTTPTPRSSTMHIYRRHMDPPSQSGIDALHTVIPIALSRPLQSIKHRCFIPLHQLSISGTMDIYIQKADGTYIN